MRLSQKVPLFLAPFIILPMLGLGSFVYLRQKHDVENGLINQSHTLIEDAVLQFEKSIHQTESDTSILAALSQVQRYMATNDPFTKYSLLQPQIIDFFKDFLNVHPEYSEIRIVLPDGMEDTRVVRNKNNRNLTDDESKSSYFKHISLSPELKTSIIDINPDTNQLAVYSSIRVSLNDLDEFIPDTEPSLRGYIIITKEITDIDKLITSNDTGLYSNFLVNIDAEIILDNFKNKKPVRSQFDFNSLVPTFSNALLNNVTEFTFDHEDSILTGKLLFPGYYLFGVIPKQIIWDETRPTALLTFMITIVSTSLLLICSIIGIRKFYIVPLEKLRMSVKDIRQDNLNIVIHETSRDDEIGDLAASFNDMQSNLKESVDEVNRLAFVDPLTNLPNRRKFMQLVNASLQRANKNKTMLGLFYIDLDDFKIVNDTMGHDIGDILIQQVAERLSGSVRANDVILDSEIDQAINLSTINNSVYRLGGDEFTVMINNITSSDDLITIANRLLDSMSRPFYLNNSPITVAISIGVALFPKHGETPTSLIKKADIAMYHAKTSGKNRFAIYDQNMKQKSEMRFHIESGIRHALNNNEFKLVYQPQFDLANKEIVGMEALIRWKQENNQCIPPNEFIPIAEESNLIIDIGHWVLERVLQDIKILKSLDIDIPTISINVSSRELEQFEFTDHLISTLKNHDLKKGQIELELTETCIMKNIEQTIICIDEMNHHEISIALDDYGTGYSSLSLLKKCKINKIKIDRSFVRDIETDENDAAIVSAIVSLSQKMGLKTVAEGIENNAQYEFLYIHGCDQGQGYYFSKPLEFEDLFILLKENKNMTDSSAEKQIA